MLINIFHSKLIKGELNERKFVSATNRSMASWLFSKKWDPILGGGGG